VEPQLWITLLTVVMCVLQFLNDHDITYCPEHVFYDVRVSSSLLNNSVSVSHILAVKLINVAVWYGNLNKQYYHNVGETICPLQMAVLVLSDDKQY